MLTVQSREYALPDGRRLPIKLYRDVNHFQHTVNDHFLHPLEPWERLLGVKFLKKTRQKLKAGEVSVLEELYDRVVPILDEGIQFSIRVPVYAVFEQERCRLGDIRWYATGGCFFLAKAGFLVVARDGLLRSARFVRKMGQKQNEPKWRLFHEARRHVRETLSKDYIDSKDKEYVKQVSHAFITPDNWSGPLHFLAED